MFGSLPLDPNNDWIRLSKLVPWREFDLKYADNFRSRKGQRACDFRMALGAVLIQIHYQGMSDSDVDLTKEIVMNPYLQYFLGLREYRHAYNESTTFQESVEFYRKAYGHDPERVLADTIFRTRENMKYCKQHGIHLNGPKLGKPYADPEVQKQQKKLEW